MTDTKTFKNLGKYLSYEEKDCGPTVGNKINISYTQPKYQDPAKVWLMGILEKDITEKLMDKILNLSAGEEVCVHTTKNAAGFSELVDITDAKDAEYKPAGGKPFTKGGYPPKDDTGIAVGAAWTNAIELLKLTNLDLSRADDKAIVKTVSNLVELILEAKLAQEAKLRAAKAGKAAPVTSAAVEEKPLTALQKAKAKKEAATKVAPVVENEVDLDEIETVDDLDDISFDGE